MQRGMSQREKPDGAASPLVAVAIDKDKNSQSAFKWALDNVVTKGQTLTLVHVNTKPSSMLSFAWRIHVGMVFVVSTHAISNYGYSPLEIDPCRNLYSSFSFGCYAAGSEDAANIIKEVFVPFRCFCTRKNVSHSISQISIATNVTEGIYANRCSATMSYSKTPTLPRLS